MADYNVPATKSYVQQREAVSYDSHNPSSSSLPAFKLKPNSIKANHHYYGIRIVTGSQVEAGTDLHQDIRVVLIGNEARSDGDKLLGWWEICYTNKQCNDLILECDQSLGKVQVVALENKAKGRHSWYVDFLEVHHFAQDEKKMLFPCYHWLGAEDLISCSSSTSLLQDVGSNSILQKHRAVQVTNRRQNYPWMSHGELCLPSSINNSVDLPLDEGFELMKNVNFFGTGLIDTIKTKVAGAGFNVDSLNGYEKYAKVLGEPDFPVYELGRWMSDVDFGRQILNGVNPVVIRKCESLPEKFPVTTEMVQSSLHRGLTLAQEMEDGHIYLCDLEIMDGVPCKDGAYCAAPLCLLYVNAVGQLNPIAIQLGQKPGDDNPIFLPTDNWIDWIAAKIYYMSSHTQFHQLSTHYLTCHAAMETYTMGLMRNIPDAHPVYKLLRPHTRYTMAINTKARESLLGANGIIAAIFSVGSEGQNEVFRRAGRKYSVYWSHVKRNVELRGVHDSSQLPLYHYRDDGILIWNAFEKYVDSIIDMFYPDDMTVKEDKELQNFAHDIHKNGFPACDGNIINGHDFPPSINSKAELVDICTLIMFTGSAQHAAVNFGQYTYYSFIPNSPAVLHRPPPAQKGKLTFEDLMNALPNEEETQNTIATASLLSKYSSDEIFVGTYPAELFVEKEAKNAAEMLRKALDKIRVEIEERNKALEVPYIYLLPKKIPNSITI